MQTIDQLTKMILDTLEVKPEDKVSISLEKEDMSDLLGLKVSINRTPQEISILYRDERDFNDEFPVYQQYFTERGAHLAHA